MDPRIRIRIHPKMSWIRNTDSNISFSKHIVSKLSTHRLHTYRFSAQPARLAGSVGAVALARPVQQLPEEPASWAGLAAPARQAQPQLQSADTAAHCTRQHSRIERYRTAPTPFCGGTGRPKLETLVKFARLSYSNHCCGSRSGFSRVPGSRSRCAKFTSKNRKKLINFFF